MVNANEYEPLELSHLHPAAQPVARLPAAERVQRIRADRWIGYPKAVEAVERGHFANEITPVTMPDGTVMNIFGEGGGEFGGCPVEGRREVGEEPRAPKAPPADDDPVAPGLRDHPQRVLGRPDVPVAEDGDARDGLLELADRQPVGLARVGLRGRAAVVRAGRDALHRAERHQQRLGVAEAHDLGGQGGVAAPADLGPRRIGRRPARRATRPARPAARAVGQ